MHTLVESQHTLEVSDLFGKVSPLAQAGKGTPGKRPPTGVPAGLTCVTGLVQIFTFVQPPTPGAQIGTVIPLGGGNAIPLIQTRPTPFGGISLSAVNNQVATVCGVFSQPQPGVQIALDVRLVTPTAPAPLPQPQPFPLSQQIIQLLILLLLIQSGFLPGVTAASLGLGSLANVDAAGLLRQAGVLQ